MSTPDDEQPPPHDETLALGRDDLMAARESFTGGESAEAGRRLGPYELHEELGRGGQGVVFRATDTRFSRVVALKILLGLGPGSEELVERFRREAAVAARIEHSGMCTVFDAGTHDGLPFIAMRYVDGESIADRIARQQEAKAATPESGSATLLARDGVMEAVEIVEQAARTLHAAHEASILHRDVKPGNIMISAEGECVVMDFGLARDGDSADMTLTRTGDLLGTPAYMSPEQLQREAHRLDARTDIWSLGATLYEAVTLERPFTGHTRDALYHDIVSRDPRSPRRVNPAVPRDLATIIETALHKDPDRRYQSAHDLAEDLRRLRAVEPIRARPVGSAGRLWRWAARNPTVASLTLLIFVGLSVGVVLLAQRGEELEDLNLSLETAIAEERQAHSETKIVRESFHELFTSFFFDDPSQREVARAHLANWCAALYAQPESDARAHRHFSAGQAYLALGMRHEAETQWRAAADLYRKLDPNGSHLLATSLLHVADGLAATGYDGPTTPEEAFRMADEARAIFARVYGPESQEVAMVDGVVAGIRGQIDGPGASLEIPAYFIKILHSLEKKRRSEAEIRAALVKSIDIGRRAWKNGRRDDAHREIRLWVDPYLSNAFVARQIPIALQRMGEQAERDGQRTLAEAFSFEAISVASEVHGPRSSDVLNYRNQHAIILYRHGRKDAAIALIEETLKRAQKWFGGAHPMVLDALDLLGETEMLRGNIEAGRAHFDERLRLTLESVTPSDSNYLYIFALRGRCESDLAGGGKKGAEAAIPWVESAIDKLSKADPPAPKRLAYAHIALGEWLIGAGREDDAKAQVELADKALESVKRPPRSLKKRLEALRTGF